MAWIPEQQEQAVALTALWRRLATTSFRRLVTVGRLYPRANPHQHMIKTEFTLGQ